MIVFYFGADSAWKQGCENSIRRRNMAILIALSEQPSVTKVYNIVRCTRDLVIKKWKEKESENTAIVNLYIAPIVPERGILRWMARPINRFLLKKMNSKAIHTSKKNKNLAWCYWPKGFEDFDYLRLDMDMIFDTDHNIIDEPNIENRLERKQLLLKAGTRAKYIVSSSRSMLDWLHQDGLKNTELLMNGVFDSRINLKSSNSETRYNVTYSGTLSKWMKIDWLTKIVRDQPHWTFNFIGDNYKTDIVSRLEQFPNVKMFGFLAPQEVDAIIKKSNVCFGLYLKEEALDVNSMKLYDYLAQGIPVVVNDYHSHLEQDFNGLLNIASTYEEFKSLLEHPKPINHEVLEQFLINATWKQRLKPILEQLTP